MADERTWFEPDGNVTEPGLHPHLAHWDHEGQKWDPLPAEWVATRQSPPPEGDDIRIVYRASEVIELGNRRYDDGFRAALAVAQVPAEEGMTAQAVTEYAVWYARKRRGPASEVAAALLEEFPWLREPLESAAPALGGGYIMELTSPVMRGDRAGCYWCAEPSRHAPDCRWNLATPSAQDETP